MNLGRRARAGSFAADKPPMDSLPLAIHPGEAFGTWCFQGFWTVDGNGSELKEMIRKR